MKIGLVDLEFEHIKNPSHYTGYEPPKKIEWIRDTPERCKIICFTERCYEKVNDPKFNGAIKVAWPLEPASIHKYGYEDLLIKYGSKFDYIFCFDHKYSQRFKLNNWKVIWWTPGGSYIYAKDWKIYSKKKNVQIIASKKDWTVGHRLRHQVIAKYKDKINSIYGRAYKYYDYQLEPFKEHRFAIVIENEIIEDYWTDKLLDCFLTGTIPIMWNNGFIKQYFNAKGMILWREIDQLEKILDGLNEELYNNMMASVKENFEVASKLYGSVEDYIYYNFFRQFENDK